MVLMWCWLIWSEITLIDDYTRSTTTYTVYWARDHHLHVNNIRLNPVSQWHRQHTTSTTSSHKKSEGWARPFHLMDFIMSLQDSIIKSSSKSEDPVWDCRSSSAQYETRWHVTPTTYVFFKSILFRLRIWYSSASALNKRLTPNWVLTLLNGLSKIGLGLKSDLTIALLVNLLFLCFIPPCQCHFRPIQPYEHVICCQTLHISACLHLHRIECSSAAVFS